MGDLTLIIPVFKTPEYLLRACLDSVLLGDFEVICVLDSPGDPCERVLDEYRDKNSNITLLKNDSNRGVSYSRNRGIAAATGKAIAFVDADDEILADVYASAVDNLLTKQLDIVAVRSAWKAHSSATPSTICGVESGAWIDSERTGDMKAFLALVSSLHYMVYAAVYRRESVLSRQVSFPEDAHFLEDFQFASKFVADAVERFGFLNKVGYLVVGHGESATHKRPTSDKFVNVITSIAEVWKSVGISDLPRVLKRHYIEKGLCALLADYGMLRAVVHGKDRKILLVKIQELLNVARGPICDELSFFSRLVTGIVRMIPRLYIFPPYPFQLSVRALIRTGLLFRCGYDEGRHDDHV